MEFMNRIELRGVVGRTDVNSFNGSKVCNFSVVTEYSSRDKEGNSAVETTWFNVSLWGREDSDFSNIVKGGWAHVTGRFRARKYTGEDELEHMSLDVIAQSVEMLEREGSAMQPQRDF